jgi:hypothetical protein
MSLRQSTSGQNSGEQFLCPRCHTLLPPQAQFCSCCGFAFGQRQNSETLDTIEIPEWEIRTVRVPREQLRYWKPPQPTLRESWPVSNWVTQPLTPDKEELAVKEQVKFASADEQRSALPPLPTTPQPEALLPVRSSTVRPVAMTSAATLPATNRRWPAIIIVSAVATALVTFVVPGIFVRPLIVFWFLCICPGMTLIPYFHVREKITLWTLVLALSFTIDALIAAIQLYARIWSPAATLAILIVLCLGGSVLQLIPKKQWRPVPIPLKRPRQFPLKRPRQYARVQSVPASLQSKQAMQTKRAKKKAQIKLPVLFRLLIGIAVTIKFLSPFVHLVHPRKRR